MKMTIKEGYELIRQLEQENKVNNSKEKEFNIEWINLILKSISKATDKAYSKAFKNL